MTKLPVTTIKERKCRKYSLVSWSIYNQNTFPFINQIRYCFFWSLCSDTLSETVSDYQL